MSIIELKLLLLIIVANAAPLIGSAIFGPRCNWPLDGGITLPDGRRLLGEHTTFRGIALAVIATSLAAVLVGLPLLHGAIVGVAAMLGDLVSSFIKRRLGLAPGDRATGLDQLPESLLPLWAVADTYALKPGDILLLGLIFMLFDMAASRLLLRFRILEHPH